MIYIVIIVYSKKWWLESRNFLESNSTYAIKQCKNDNFSDFVSTPKSLFLKLLQFSVSERWEDDIKSSSHLSLTENWRSFQLVRDEKMILNHNLSVQFDKDSVLSG